MAALSGETKRTAQQFCAEQLKVQRRMWRLRLAQGRLGGKRRAPYLDEIYQILKMKSELGRGSDLYLDFE